MSNSTRRLARVLPVLLMIVAAPAARSAPDPELAKLCDEYWQGYLRTEPMFATSIGDRRFDDQLSDITPAAIESNRQRMEGLLARARAFDAAKLAGPDRLNRATLIETLEGHLANLSCHFEDWVVDPLGGPQVEFFNLADYTLIRTPEDAGKFVQRCRAMGKYMDDHIANLRSGLQRGRVASRDPVEKVAEQLDGLLAEPVSEWALMGPAKAEHQDWTPAQREQFRTDLTAALDGSLKPGLVRYRD